MIPYSLSLILASSAASITPADLPVVPIASEFTNLESRRPVAAPESRWWQSFNDPYLNTLIEQALQQSFDIAEAAARLDRARAGIRFAAGAKLPAIAASADAAAVRLSKEDPEFQSVSNLPGFERNVDRYSVSIGASWELDLFGRLGDREKAAVADTASASWKLEAAKLTVTTEIAQRYITLRLLQQRNIVAERRAFTLSEQARLSAMRVERGVSPAIERDRLIAEARIARSSVPPLLAAIEDQMARIDVLVGRTVGTSREELGEAQALPTLSTLPLHQPTYSTGVQIFWPHWRAWQLKTPVSPEPMPIVCRASI
jgi:outer membrane protein TolC